MDYYEKVSCRKQFVHQHSCHKILVRTRGLVDPVKILLYLYSLITMACTMQNLVAVSHTCRPLVTRPFICSESQVQIRQCVTQCEPDSTDRWRSYHVPCSFVRDMTCRCERMFSERYRAVSLRCVNFARSVGACQRPRSRCWSSFWCTPGRTTTTACCRSAS